MSDTDGIDPKSPKRPPLTIDLEPDPAPKPEGNGLFDGWYGLAATSAGVGGVLGLALSLTLAGTGLWPAPYRPEAPATARLADPAPEIAALKTALDAEKTETAKITARLDATTKALDALKSAPAVASAQPQPVPVVADPRVEALEARLAKLEALPGTISPLASSVEALNARVGDLAKAEPKAPVTDPAVLDRLKALEALSGDIAALKSADAEMAQQLAALTKRFDEELAKLSAGVNRVSGEISNAGQSRQEAVLALALSDLKANIDGGRAFRTELAATRAAAPDLDLAALEHFADKGVPTLAQLKTKFPDVARRVIAADQAASAPAGAVDRFLANARQSLNVRRLDAPGDDSAEARLARIDTALAGGRTAEAVKEWQGLPDTAKTEALDFGAALRARATVDDLLATTTRKAMDRLAGQSQ